MNIVASLLFVLAAAAAAVTIRASIAAALPSIRGLRRALAEGAGESRLHVSTLDTRAAGRQSRRPRRLHQPKPVTHRLHQYPHRAHAA